MCGSGPGGGLDFGITGVWPAKPNVVARGRRKNDRVLRNQSDLTTKIGARHVAQVYSVK